MVEVGKPAPDFTLLDQQGKKVTLSKLKGSTIVLYFYPKDDTSGCTKEACGFRDAHDDYAAAGAKILGVSPDGPESHTNSSPSMSCRLPCWPTPRPRSAHSTASGKRRACTAGSTWASSGPHS